MKVLVACEFSGVVRDAFTAKGHDATSCDLLESDSPGQHYQGDVRDILHEQWDLIISFPPCTHLATSGSIHFPQKIADGRQQAAIDFFNLFTEKNKNLKCDKVAIENPICIMSTKYREPDQIVQPYYFGEPYTKTTCLWLRNLPLLQHFPQDDFFNQKTWCDDKGETVEFVSKKTGKVKRQQKWYADAYIESKKSGEGDKAGHLRSKTFQGIANAMAEYWG